MRLTANGKELKEAILWGAKGINRSLGESARGAQTVLTVEGGMLHVKSFDGSKFFTAQVAASGITDDDNINVRIFGETLVNATNVLKNEPVTIDISDTEVTLILPRSEFSIPRSQVGGPQFPDYPTKVGTVNAGELRKVSVKAATTALKDAQAQPVLGAVLYEFSPGYSRLRLESTNRISMFIYDLEYLPDNDFQSHVTTPEDIEAGNEGGSQTVATSVTNDGKVNALVSHELVRVLMSGVNDADDVTLYVNDNYFGIEGGGYAGFVSQIDADPINYMQLMKSSVPKQFTTNRKDFITAVKNVNNMSHDGERVLIHVSTESVIRVTDVHEKARAELDVENIQGMVDNNDEMNDEEDAGETIKFNPEMLLAALNAATTEKVTLCYSEVVRPMVLREVKVDGDLDKQFFYMVMPLR